MPLAPKSGDAKSTLGPLPANCAHPFIAGAGLFIVAPAHLLRQAVSHSDAGSQMTPAPNLDKTRRPSQLDIPFWPPSRGAASRGHSGGSG